MVETMMLRQFLQGEWLSRRLIIDLVSQGKVFLNDASISNAKQELKSWDRLKIPSLQLDFTIEEKQGEKSDFSSLVVFNKPIGYTCSKADPHNQTIYDLLPQEFRKKYYYIGRLDKESRGLMLLTAYPQMVHDFEHPSKNITKEYLVQLNRPFDRKLERRILEGIKHEGELLRTVKIYAKSSGQIWIVLNEGKKRHIRRIFRVLGYEVIDLQRIRIGKYRLGDLPEGERKEIII